MAYTISESYLDELFEDSLLQRRGIIDSSSDRITLSSSFAPSSFGVFEPDTYIGRCGCDDPQCEDVREYYAPTGVCCFLCMMEQATSYCSDDGSYDGIDFSYDVTDLDQVEYGLSVSYDTLLKLLERYTELREECGEIYQCCTEIVKSGTRMVCGDDWKCAVTDYDTGEELFQATWDFFVCAQCKSKIWRYEEELQETYEDMEWDIRYSSLPSYLQPCVVSLEFYEGFKELMSIRDSQGIIVPVDCIDIIASYLLC
jgi:hypothetical protein